MRGWGMSEEVVGCGGVWGRGKKGEIVHGINYGPCVHMAAPAMCLCMEVTSCVHNTKGVSGTEVFFHVAGEHILLIH